MRRFREVDECISKLEVIDRELNVWKILSLIFGLYFKGNKLGMWWIGRVLGSLKFFYCLVCYGIISFFGLVKFIYDLRTNVNILDISFCILNLVVVISWEIFDNI